MMAKLIKSIGQFRPTETGTASVEFVFILPILAIMLFGTIDIGRLLFDYHAVSKSVRDATRYLAREDATALTLDTTTCVLGAGVGDATMGGLTPKQKAANLAMTGSANGAAPLLLTYWTNASTVTFPTQAPVDNTGGTFLGYFTGANQICSVTIDAEISFPILNGWLLGRGNTLTFTISHNEVHLGQ